MSHLAPSHHVRFLFGLLNLQTLINGSLSRSRTRTQIGLLATNLLLEGLIN
jgi:hypothetical protein